MVSIKKALRKKIINRFIVDLRKQEEIVSVTFVGSFIDKNNLNKINDIDLIIVTNRLDKKNFKKYLKLIKKVNPKKFNIGKDKLIINTTFGPLKFNKKESDLVIHLMIYDIEGHINHCIKSPFTVHDWERSNFFYKNKMNDLFPVGILQLRDFIEARRGIENYLKDLIKKKISYREYKFNNKSYQTVLKNINLLKRDKFEFYYHITKNLILNYIKYINQKNKLYFFQNNDKKIVKYFGKNFYNKHIQNINYLFYKKENFNFAIENKIDKWMIDFIKDYSNNLNKLSRSAKKVFFFRHEKTKLNDGSFLGQNRNPGIINQKKKIKKQKFSKIYTSPLKRCVESVKILCKNKIYVSDKNLLEINYGKAEGMSLSSLKKSFPLIKKKWSQKKDLKFPEGESYKDVSIRVKKFINKLTKVNSNNSCVITHNVFLRVLIGQIFNIPKEKWHKIYIPHLMKLEFTIINNKFYPNIKRDNLKKIFLNLN